MVLCTLVNFELLEDLIKDFASFNLDMSTSTNLNKLYIVFPFLSHAQQCQGLAPSLFSVKFTSNLGL